jgi:purine-binding chemotaxis protein CheW
VSTGDDVQLVVFRVGSQAFAVNIFEAERILRYQEPTPLPGCPAFLEGVFPFGEHVIPLIDLRKRLGVPAPVRDETRVVVLGLEVGPVGVVVDAVLAVRKVPAAAITPPSGLVKGLAAEYVHGITVVDGRTVVILAAGRLFSSTEQISLRDLLVEAGTWATR